MWAAKVPKPRDASLGLKTADFAILLSDEDTISPMGPFHAHVALVRSDGSSRVIDVDPTHYFAMTGNRDHLCVWTTTGLSIVRPHGQVHRLRMDRRDDFSYFSGLQPSDNSCLTVVDPGLGVGGEYRWNVQLRKATGVTTIHGGGVSFPSLTTISGDRLYTFVIGDKSQGVIYSADLSSTGDIAPTVRFKLPRFGDGVWKPKGAQSLLIRDGIAYWVAEFSKRSKTSTERISQWTLHWVPLDSGATGSRLLETTRMSREHEVGGLFRTFSTPVTDAATIFYLRRDGAIRGVNVESGRVDTRVTVPAPVRDSMFCSWGGWRAPRLAVACMGEDQSFVWSADLRSGAASEILKFPKLFGWAAQRYLEPTVVVPLSTRIP